MNRSLQQRGHGTLQDIALSLGGGGGGGEAQAYIFFFVQ